MAMNKNINAKAMNKNIVVIEYMGSVQYKNEIAKLQSTSTDDRTKYLWLVQSREIVLNKFIGSEAQEYCTEQYIEALKLHIISLKKLLDSTRK